MKEQINTHHSALVESIVETNDELLDKYLEGEKIDDTILSNVFKNAAEPYDRYVKSAKTDLLRVGAHYSISSMFEDYPEQTDIYCYTARSEVHNRTEAGKLKLVTGKSTVTSNITWEEKTISFAVLHLGDHNINAGVREFADEKKFSIMQDEMKASFIKGDTPESLRLMDKHFGEHIYSLWHLFKDEQRKVLDQILQLTYDSVDSSYRHIYEDNFAIMGFYHNLQQRLPRPFYSAAEYTLNIDLKKIFEDDDLDIERLNRLIEESKKWDVNLDKTTIGYIAGSWLNSLMEKLSGKPDDIMIFSQIENAMDAISPLYLSIDLWKAQNEYFSTGKDHYETMKKKAENGDNLARQWIDGFIKLGTYLHVKI